MAFYPDERIAIFIDGANFYSTGKSLEFDIDYKKMLELFKGKGRLIRANYYTALLEHCLLYTSPSPRDQRGSRMPSSA